MVFKKEVVIFEIYVIDFDKWYFVKFKDDFLLMNIVMMEFIILYLKFYVKKVGICMGSIICEELVLNYDLVLSIYLFE